MISIKGPGLAILAVGLAVSGPGRVDAAFMTYTETAIGSGTFDGKAFSGAMITITGSGDTASIFRQPLQTYVVVLPVVSNSVTVAGLGTDTFTLSNLEVISNQGVDAGGFVYGPGGAAVIADSNAAFAKYALVGPIGPLTGSPLFTAGTPLATSGGSLKISSLTTASFTASAVPEPSSFALCCCGVLIGLGYNWSRRMRFAG